MLRGKDKTTFSRQACFVNRFTLQGFNERIFMTTVYTRKIICIINKVVKYSKICICYILFSGYFIHDFFDLLLNDLKNSIVILMHHVVVSFLVSK